MGSIFHNRQYRTILVVALLLASTAAAYWQVGSHAFINYDDPDYIYDNPHVRSGLTLANVAWAFTTIHAANWHPLTWLSHMLDVDLFGMNPAGHHLVNAVLHAANAALLFLLFNRLTGALWRSAVVAAIFALHPLHVESVAWAAERKDLLCALFWMITLCFYTGYVRTQKSSRYVLALISFACGLMAKPMIVTLPIVMLLLDYWPLGRFDGWACVSSDIRKRSVWYLLREKIPFIVLSAASCAVTVYAQQTAMESLEAHSLFARIINALVVYAGYLEKTIWPRGLAVFYPFASTISFWQYGGAALLLAATTLTAIRLRRQRPYFLVGWFWYLCTLVPVIGIVQVGFQSMADRYTYIPMTGFLIILVWGVADVATDWPYRHVTLSCMVTAVLLACIGTTWRQLSYWQNNSTLYAHAISVTDNNFIAHNNLGFDLASKDNFDKAIRHYNEAILIAPLYALAHLNLGVSLRNVGKLDDAVVQIAEAIRLKPDNAAAYNELGAVMLSQGKVEEAIDNFKVAIRKSPTLADGYYNLGLAYSNQGKSAMAVEQYTISLGIKPDDIDGHYNMGIALASLGRYDEAKKQFSEVLSLKPDSEMQSLARQSLERVLQQEATKIPEE